MNRKMLVAGSLLALTGCAGNVDAPGAGGTDDPEELDTAPEPLRAGDVIAYAAETSHPYAGGWKQAITSPGATFVRVHFNDFSLAKGDYVTVSSPDGAQSFRYEDRGPNGDGDVWAFAIDGETAIVELHSSTGGGHGFSIADIGHGTIAIAPDPVTSGEATPGSVALARRPGGGTPDIVCATEGREPIVCHPELDVQQRPVARLLFARGTGMYLCTGWLIATEDKDRTTLITNNHCISTQEETNSLETRFGYQRTACDSSTMAAVAAGEGLMGGSLLKTNSRTRTRSRGGLDYTLIRLPGNPQTTWGVLTPTTKAPRVGNPIHFIQHPAGRPKEIGFWRDDAHTLRCQIDALDQTYSGTLRGSQIGYSCDSEGGSSGSPIIDAGTGLVVGLHHLADVAWLSCRNGGTEMSAICADAGELIRCVNN
ncbi:trypsin-like serine peptidase [Sorangium sp. KYC3313]|uniref:trypsin-like serine peptidase n=1 Tax=Sorangium sp. KYC3313 TaxID=3449740 RepID=UPI003F899BA0